MIASDKVKKILYGGDYNPEQWDEEIWHEDMQLFKKANIDIVTLNVFSWASLQPDENSYDFSKLDKIMDLVLQNDLNICLATSTAAHPAWMARKYPEILRTEFNGIKRKFGGRHNSCPNSSIYRKYSTALARKLAERYGQYNNIVAWHISNEYGGECYCENCEKAFRVWLMNKYQTIDNLNRDWGTAFWGHTFYDWDDIVLPNLLSEHFAENRTMFQPISLDYKRFNSDSILDCYRLEYEAIKNITPSIPITTNFMGFYKALDYAKWAKYMDFISWDNYPAHDSIYTEASMAHDLMRGIGGGKPFALMEQTPSISNWHPYCALKRPNVMRLWSYQAIAHGADTVMFFQMRRSITACEKYHSGVIEHVGNDETRVFREMKALGKELIHLDNKTLGSKSKSKTAIYFDWNNWWAIEYSAGPSIDLKYYKQILNFYTALNHMNIPVDFISGTDELNDYELVIAPVFYLMNEGYDEKIKSFVKAGGTFVTTFFSGYVNENDKVYLGGYPGKLRDLLGIWVEEIDALPSDTMNQFVYEGNTYPANLLCDLLHLEGATSLANYEKDFYAGMPAVTQHSYGNGKAYYIATASDEYFYKHFLMKLCVEKNITPVLNTPEGVEATIRTKDQETFLFLLNHNEDTCHITAPCDCTDLITDTDYTKGSEIEMTKKDVKILFY